MGRIEINLIFNNQDAKEHPDILIRALAQQLHMKYGISQMEKLEIPFSEFKININVEEGSNIIDWNSLNYPDLTIKEKIEEIIYYTDIKNSIERILLETSGMGFERRDDLLSISYQLIFKVEKLSESKYFRKIQELPIDKIVGELKHTFGEDGEFLRQMKLNSPNRRKLEAVSEFKSTIKIDLLELNSALEDLID